MVATVNPILCRTCTSPRGENIADGTRCARCGQKHALVLWIASGVAAMYWSLDDGLPFVQSLVAAAVTFVVMPAAAVSALLVHEIIHAATGRLFGFTVTRMVIGEGRALFRLGRDPQLVVGSVVLGNGLTMMQDLRWDGYRTRWIIVLLIAPIASAAIAALVWLASVEWPFAARVAAIVFAAANGLIAVITLIPVPTFQGRVWSDLASALYLARATDAQLAEHMLLSVQDRAAALVEAGETDRAVDAARAGVAAQPDAVLARSVLAYALFRAGRFDEMRQVAHEALARDIDDDARAYLQRLLEEAAAGLIDETRTRESR
jgi:hypothetical protein